MESLLLDKLLARRIQVVPSQKVRQALFDLGSTTVTPENKAAVAEKLQVDAFVIPSVGSAKTDTTGVVAIPMYGGGIVATPVMTNSGAVEIMIVAADTGRLLMHGVASGESAWRTKKGVVGTMFDQIMDRAFSPQFYEVYLTKK